MGLVNQNFDSKTTSSASVSDAVHLDAKLDSQMWELYMLDKFFVTWHQTDHSLYAVGEWTITIIVFMQ